MKRLRDTASNRPLAVLGGRTLKENYEWWLERERRGANSGGPNYVPPPRLPEAPPPAEDGTEREKLRLHLERCGVPERIIDILDGGLTETAAVQSVRAWWGIGGSFKLLHGESRAGKSVAAATVFLRMRNVVRWDGGSREDWDSAECAWVTADELARLGYFSEEAHQLLEHLGRVACVVIDDLGAEMHSESWRATLDSLLSERFGRTRCRTVLTTNLSAKRTSKTEPSPFEQRYGARIARRIRESGSVTAVEREET